MNRRALHRRALLGFGLSVVAISAVSSGAMMPAQAIDLQLAKEIPPLVNQAKLQPTGLQLNWQIGQQTNWRRGPRPRWGGSQ